MDLLMIDQKIKQELIDASRAMVSNKLHIIDAELEQLQNSANEETKSSAGDKYETSRAMLMLEKEKLFNQKEQLVKQMKSLQRVDFSKTFDKVASGALVETSTGNYFILSGIGEVTVSKVSFFVVSPLAPVVQALLGKGTGDKIPFNGKLIEIQSII